MSGEIEQRELETVVVDEVQEPDYNPEVFDSLNEEPEETEKPSVEIPEKFRDKSLEDVVKSYQELERGFGKQANELGELRRLADSFLRQELENKRQASTPPPEPGVDLDQFVQDPDRVLKEVIRKELEPQQRQFQQYAMTQDLLSRREQIMKKHGDMEDILNNKDFASWVQESPYRQRMMADAHFNWDVTAADSLFTEWKMINKEAVQKQDQRVQRDLKATAAESGGTKKGKGAKYRRADLITMRIKDPERFEELQDEIQKAYAEGRVI